MNMFEKIQNSRLALSVRLKSETWEGSPANRALLEKALGAGCQFDLTVPEPHPYQRGKDMPLLWYAMREWPDLIDTIHPHLLANDTPLPNDYVIREWFFAQAVKEGPRAVRELLGGWKGDQRPHMPDFASSMLVGVMGVATRMAPPVQIPALWEEIFAVTNPFYHSNLLGTGQGQLCERMGQWTLSLEEALGMREKWDELFEKLPALSSEHLLSVFTRDMRATHAPDNLDDPALLPARLLVSGLVAIEIDRLEKSDAWTRRTRHRIGDPFMDHIIRDQPDVYSSLEEDISGHPVWKDGLVFDTLEARARGMLMDQTLPAAPSPVRKRTL